MEVANLVRELVAVTRPDEVTVVAVLVVVDVSICVGVELGDVVSVVLLSVEGRVVSLVDIRVDVAVVDAVDVVDVVRVDVGDVVSDVVIDVVRDVDVSEDDTDVVSDVVWVETPVEVADVVLLTVPVEVAELVAVVDAVDVAVVVSEVEAVDELVNVGDVDVSDVDVSDVVAEVVTVRVAVVLAVDVGVVRVHSCKDPSIAASIRVLNAAAIGWQSPEVIRKPDTSHCRTSLPPKPPPGALLALTIWFIRAEVAMQSSERKAATEMPSVSVSTNSHVRSLENPVQARRSWLIAESCCMHFASGSVICSSSVSSNCRHCT